MCVLLVVMVVPGAEHRCHCWCGGAEGRASLLPLVVVFEVVSQGYIPDLYRAHTPALQCGAGLSINTLASLISLAGIPFMFSVISI